MKTDELKTLKELIDGFDTKYYEKENENLRREINNIRMGRPRHEGILDKYRKDIVPIKQVEQEIDKLNKEIMDNKEKQKELGQALSQLRMSAGKLETIVEQEILLRQLKNLISNRSHLEFGKTDIYEENNDKYKKLYLKSNKKVKHSKLKISKEIYKLINKNRLYKAYQSKFSIANALKSNNILIKDKYDPGNKFYSDAMAEYRGFPYFDDISRLGVDVSALDYARKKIKGELDSDSLTWHGEEAFKKLKDIEKAKKTNINIKVRHSHLIEIEEKYTEIEELSRETWYLNEILQAFSNTDITKTEMYKGLRELVREQELLLSKLIREVDKEYEKTGLQNKIDLIEQLEELYRKIEELNLKIEQYKNMGREDQADYCQQEYYNVRYEMIKILKDNPDLNKPKYNIDIKKIIEEERKMFEPEIKKGLNKPEQPIVEENKDYRISSEIPSYIKTPEEEIFVEKTVPQTSVTEQKVVENVTNTEEIPSYIKTPEEEMFVEKAYIEESGKLERFELDSSLQIFRTMHYQGYMREKVLNSDLGKLSFSAYLESVAPHLTKLIELEKERETLARTIYRDYIRYYSSLENKKDAIEFYEFAGNNYGISNVDVPIEHEEEYKGMIKR